MFRLSAVVILYHPDETCSFNICSYLDQVDVLYIFDNSPQKNNLYEEITQNPKVKYFHDSENKGISARLNQALKYSRNDECDWLLTMDQDSNFEYHALKNYKDCIDNFPQKGAVAVFGVEHEKKMAGVECKFSDEDNLITSGSVVNVKIAKGIGGFDELLFIDEVDFEYCYRAKKNGFKVLKLGNIFLNHTIGEQSDFRSLKNLKKSKRALHSPARTYYMVRNHFYVRDKYQKLFPDVFKKRRSNIFTSLKNNLIYGKNRTGTFLAIIKGYNDYKRNKFGKR